MTEERFEIIDSVHNNNDDIDLYDNLHNNKITHGIWNKCMVMANWNDTVDVMNELAEENEELKQSINYWIGSYDELYKENKELEKENEKLKSKNQKYKFLLQDKGLLMSDDEIIDIRNEIVDKMIKPLFEKKGIDIDVDTKNGFEIIPKSDFE